MNTNTQFYNGNSFNNDFIFSKELYTLINHKISTDLKGYSLFLLDDSRLLINHSINQWVFHISNDRWFWNKEVLQNTFELFSIFDVQIQGFIFYKWIKNLIKEELNEESPMDIFLEDSSSNRAILISRIINVSTNLTILESGSKYLKKEYWSSKPNFIHLNKFNIFLN